MSTGWNGSPPGWSWFIRPGVDVCRPGQTVMNRDDGTANIFLRTGDNTGTNRQTLDPGEPGKIPWWWDCCIIKHVSSFKICSRSTQGYSRFVPVGHGSSRSTPGSSRLVNRDEPWWWDCSISHCCVLIYCLGITKGDTPVILSSPEALEQGPWMDMIRGYSERISLVAFDEVHCLSEWFVLFS